MTPPVNDLALDSVRPAAQRASMTPEVVRLAWPAMLQGLLHTVVFLTDRVMLGHYSADALASMQISGPLLWSVCEVFTAFTAGTIATVGRAVGAGDARRTRSTVLAVMLVATAMGLAVGALGFATRGPVSDLLTGSSTSPHVRELAQTFMGLLFPFTLCYFVGTGATTVLQASGDTRTPMLAAIVAEVVNVAVNWVFIFGHLGAPELGVSGAALGSAVAFTANAGILVAALVWRKDSARLVFERFNAEHKRALGAVLRISRATFVERVVYHAGFMAYVAQIGRLGDLAMAANQALIAIESIGFVGAEGIGIAAGALVAQKLGAGRPDDANRAGWTATGLGVLCLSGASLLFLGAPNALLGLFTRQSSIIALGASCLFVAAFAQPLMAITHGLASALRGAGDTRNPMIVAFVGPVLIRLAATWFFAFALDLGLLGVWIGSTCDWLVRSVWLAVIFRRGRWRDVEVSS